MNLLSRTFSTIDVAFCKSYMRIDEDFTEDDQLIELYLQSAKQYILQYTEMTPVQLDKIGFVCIVILKLVSDFHSNKSIYTQGKAQIDPMVESLLAKLRHYTI